MPSFLLMFLKAKLVALLFLIRLVCAYPIGMLQTILLSMYTIISRSVPQPDVFQLPVQSVGALTSLIKIVFVLLISVSFLNKNTVLFPCITFRFYFFMMFYFVFNFNACL
jgi:hypothetical protein